MRYLPIPALVAMCLACAGAEDPSKPSTSPTAPDPVGHSSFEMTARILGPVERDDASHIEVTLRETAGVAATLHFVRMTCTNGASQEWGASSFVGELGSNVVAAHSEIRFQRSYRCPASARPARVRAELTDANGMDHVVEAAPFHPDWPG